MLQINIELDRALIFIYKLGVLNVIFIFKLKNLKHIF